MATVERLHVRTLIVLFVFLFDKVGQNVDASNARQTGALAGGSMTVPQRRMALRLCVMCADVSHVVRPLPAHLRWTGLLAEEFRLQVRAARCWRVIEI